MKPHKLKSGNWNIRIYAGTVNGKRQYKSITAPTKAEVEFLASDYKRNRIPKTARTLSQAIDKYIADKSHILSPSTIRGYRYIQRKRFPEIMNKEIASIKDWQKAINDDASIYAPKTVKNDWALISTVLRYFNLPVPKVALPQIVQKPLPYLTAEQIAPFLQAIKGKRCEMMSLLALHSLRRSELLAITKENCTGGIIRVRGSVVCDEHEKMVYKETNKTASSVRDIPILIPRLAELIDDAPDGYLVKGDAKSLRMQLNKICKDAGLPVVSVHGLRRSFASVGYGRLNERQLMRLGGWSNYATVHKFYVQISQAEMDAGIEKLADFFGNASRECITEE